MKKLIKKILGHLPLKRYVIFESNPDFCDNPYYVYKEFLKHKTNERYKLVWFVTYIHDIKLPKNVIQVKLGSYKAMYYRAYAKIIVDCNRYIPKLNKKQFRITLTHGMPFKNVDGYCSKAGDFNYVNCISPFFKEEIARCFITNENKVTTLGYPRNDELFNCQNGLKKKLFKDQKVILWLPTYRNHKNGGCYATEYELPLGIPSINSLKEANELNEVLKQNNTLLILKVHPAQDLTKLNELNLSNFKVLKDDYLFKNNINLYNLLAVTDAMITDYSSVYFDYLLTQKPIGLAVSDLEVFKKEVGFVYDFYDTLLGNYIFNIDEFKQFIIDVANNKDQKKKELKKALKKYYEYPDNKSSKRVYDFIKENVKDI